MNEIIGILNLFASSISLIVFLYPSGRIIPKFLSILLFKSSPLSCPKTSTDFLSKSPKPAIIDLSSENALIYLLINAKFVGIPIMSNEFNNVEKVIRDVIDESNAPAIKKSWLITSDELPSNKELLLKSAKLNNNYHSPVAEISHFSKSKNFIIWSPINQ